MRTIVSNASSGEEHAYCEVFSLEENDSEVNDLLYWTKTEYGQTEVPVLVKIRNVVWMNMHWWTAYLGGPYFEDGERRIFILTNPIASPARGKAGSAKWARRSASFALEISLNQMG
jgi:hypothetical protein